MHDIEVCDYGTVFRNFHDRAVVRKYTLAF